MKQNKRESSQPGPLIQSQCFSLVEELTKEHPEQSVVKKLMTQMGLHYTSDPVSQMSLVLDLMNQTSQKSKDDISL